MSAPALVEDASADAAPVPATGSHSRSEVARAAVLAAAVVVGLPGVVELSRLLTTIVLSLILGH